MPAPHHSVFLQARCPSCHPTNSVKALKEKHQRVTILICHNHYYTSCYTTSVCTLLNVPEGGLKRLLTIVSLKHVTVCVIVLLPVTLPVLITARWYASVVYAVVCLSICPLQVSVLLKRLNVGSQKHLTIAHGGTLHF